MYALSCHTLINDLPPSGSSPILQSLTDMLSEKYHIGHATVQFECSDQQGVCCETNGLYCRMEDAKEKSNGHHPVPKVMSLSKNNP
jgi:cobalt-zinc-cadmium efflux system protein